jgi:hypothetical protein
MMPEKHGKNYTPWFNFQVIMKILSGPKAIARIASSYGAIRSSSPKRPSSIATLLKETGSNINLMAGLSESNNLEVSDADFRKIIYPRG